MDNNYVSRADMLQGKCPKCQQPIGDFTDALSRKEYCISGLCQKCQDEVFNYDPDDGRDNWEFEDTDCGESWYDKFDLEDLDDLEYKLIENDGDNCRSCDPADCKCGDNWFPDERDYLVDEIAKKCKEFEAEWVGSETPLTDEIVRIAKKCQEINLCPVCNNVLTIYINATDTINGREDESLRKYECRICNTIVSKIDREEK